MLAVVWCFGQLAVLYQETGGPVIYARKGFGDAAAFLIERWASILRSAFIGGHLDKGQRHKTPGGPSGVFAFRMLLGQSLDRT